MQPSPSYVETLELLELSKFIFTPKFGGDTLPETNSKKPLKIGRNAAKGKDRLPTIIFLNFGCVPIFGRESNLMR